MSNHKLKVVISLLAIIALVLRKVKPDLLDPTDLVIAGIGLLPWLSSLIKSAEVPGVGKIEFQDVAGAGDKVTGGSTPPSQEGKVPDFVRIASSDPNLALVSLRIEIEARVRKLADKHGLVSSRSGLMSLFKKLQGSHILTDPVLSGLQELVMFGNQAAHGARVESDAAEWAVEYGPGVISALDDALAK